MPDPPRGDDRQMYLNLLALIPYAIFRRPRRRILPAYRRPSDERANHARR